MSDVPRTAPEYGAHQYLVWSHEHSAWWGPGGNGYTQHLDAAGRYSRAEALRICVRAMPGAIPVLNELPVRVEDLEYMTSRFEATYGAEAHKQPWK